MSRNSESKQFFHKNTLFDFDIQKNSEDKNVMSEFLCNLTLKKRLQ